MEDEGLLGILDSAEHRMIRDTVREFCEEEIRPIAQRSRTNTGSPTRCSPT